jgi:hypothetical protein
MIPVATFVGACIALFAMYHLKKVEQARGHRFVTSGREVLDVHTARFFSWCQEYATPEALWAAITRTATMLTHHIARIMAKFAHALEYQARTVVHKTSKRVRKDMHYLEEVVHGTLDKDEKKGNNTPSE